MMTEMEDMRPVDIVERRRQLQPQQSTVFTRRQQAVCVRRAFKHYGSKKSPNVIFDGLNMTVPKGCIYGLLGASGCGKTTLLSCIVGIRKLMAGEIWVLGGRPGCKGSGVPGPRIGYMPQDISLYGEFTIKETMRFFGWITGMETDQVEQKTEFLVSFLQLPPSSRQVKNLSGGQQRRVSFAAALLHEPELLILDEPTVGVDPLLRQSIWSHLVQLTKEGKTTVIITTHYIEETRQAGIVGLMRGGKFLAEDSPEQLMAMHNLDTLEDVFLKLSKMQNQKKRRRSSFMQEILGPPSPEDLAAIDTSSEISGEFGDNVSVSVKDLKSATVGSPVRNSKQGIITDLPPIDSTPSGPTFSSIVTIMKALIWKNFLWMWRNVGVMMFMIGLPIMQVVLFYLSIGQDPKGLHFAIFNEELNSSTEECIPSTGCNLMTLSCRYLAHFQKHQVVLDYYDSIENAKYAVEKGYAWGAFHFSANFSDSLLHRLEDGRSASEKVIDESNIKVWMDMSNQQIGQLMNRNILLSFVNFTRDVLSECNYNYKTAELPVRFNKPVYGPSIPSFTDFAAPGVILTIIFFLAVALTSGAMLIEKNEGMMERSMVSGVTWTQILFAHVITQFAVMCFQSIFVLVFSFAVFRGVCEGDMLTVVCLTILTGLCGMSFGFVVSSLCDNERNATYLALGSFLPFIMLCGIIWPVEGMNYFLRLVSIVLPLTKCTEAMRVILSRGWEITNPVVYYGFIGNVSWIVIFLSASILILKFKKG